MSLSHLLNSECRWRRDDTILVVKLRHSRSYREQEEEEEVAEIDPKNSPDLDY